MTIRLAAETDKALLTALEDSARDAGGAKPFVYSDPLQRGHFYPWADTLVCEGSYGEIVGAVTISTKPLKQIPLDSVGHIFGLRVDPKCQRQGIGKKLLGAACKVLDDKGCLASFGYVGTDNRPSQGLFRSHGFAPCSTASYFEATPAEFVDEHPTELSPDGTSTTIERLKGALFAPDDLSSNLFSHNNPNYLGSWVAEGGNVAISLWDKDRWLGRTKEGLEGLFISAVHFSKVTELTAMLGEVARRMPHKNKVTIVLDHLHQRDALRDPRLNLDRVEDILVRWRRPPPHTGQPMFLDIRD